MHYGQNGGTLCKKVFPWFLTYEAGRENSKDMADRKGAELDWKG